MLQCNHQQIYCFRINCCRVFFKALYSHWCFVICALCLHFLFWEVGGNCTVYWHSPGTKQWPLIASSLCLLLSGGRAWELKWVCLALLCSAFTKEKKKEEDVIAEEKMGLAKLKCAYYPVFNIVCCWSVSIQSHIYVRNEPWCDKCSEWRYPKMLNNTDTSTFSSTDFFPIPVQIPQKNWKFLVPVTGYNTFSGTKFFLYRFRYFFSSTKFFWYRFRDFFRYKFFPIPVQIPQKNGKFLVPVTGYNTFSGTKFFRYRFRYFFPVPNFSVTGSETFLLYQIFPIPVPIFFCGTNFFWYWFRDFFR